MRLKQAVRAAARRPAWPAVAAAPFAPALLVLLPVGASSVLAGAVTGTLVLFTALIALQMRRAVTSARTVATKARKPRRTSAGGHGRRGGEPKELRRWQARLNHGWSSSATESLLDMVDSGTVQPVHKVKALTALCEYRGTRWRERRTARTIEVDIVIVSALNLSGGTTSSNEAEILAYRSAGLKVGLVHHPVLRREIDRPIHPRIQALIDDDQVLRIHPEDTVRCDLAVVRFPAALEQLIEDRPSIKAERTVLLINQTPFEEYGLTGGYGTAWSIRDVHRNITEWLGPHTWYVIGPAVRDVLTEHHAEELAGVDLSADFWYGTIDVADWTPATRRVRAAGEPIRIGRHSRDHVTKFPNMAKRLLAAYPEAEGIEVHILGGRKAVTGMLGWVPASWTVHPFGSIAPVEFLAGMDVYVYFIDENYIEAFGRAPLEALAVGVPCILPWSFAELFGDGALYCEPNEAEDLARRLMADPTYYAERAEAGLRVIRERFSPEALLHRVSELGVSIDRPRTSIPSSTSQRP